MGMADEARRHLEAQRAAQSAVAAEYPAHNALYQPARADALATVQEAFEALKELGVRSRPKGPRKSRHGYWQHFPGGWILRGDGDLVLGHDGHVYGSGNVRRRINGQEGVSYGRFALLDNLGDRHPIGFYVCSSFGPDAGEPWKRFAFTRDRQTGEWYVDFGSVISPDYVESWSGIGVGGWRAFLTGAVTRLHANPDDLG